MQNIQRTPREGTLLEEKPYLETDALTKHVRPLGRKTQDYLDLQLQELSYQELHTQISE